MDIKLDVKRLLCPMPVIRLQEKMEELNQGDKIKIIATDKGVKHDIPAWCRVHQHKVLSIEETDKEIIIVVEKK
jgi:tRNA 2-thiouridine synthesizing protein A